MHRGWRFLLGLVYQRGDVMGMNGDFNAGDVVYSPRGQQFEYVARAMDGHIVRPVFESDYDEPHYGDPELHPQVFGEIPANKYAADVAETLEKLEAAKEQLTEVRLEIAAAEREREELRKRLLAHPNLEPLADWLDGKITHVATFSQYGGGIKIQTIAEAVLPNSHDDRRNGEVRLLALYGGYTGPETKDRYGNDNLRWQLNSYRDGSGSNLICILGTSEDNVKERLQRYLDAEFKKSDRYTEHVSWAESAIRLGLSVPEKLATAVAERQETVRLAEVKRAQEELQRATANVAALQAKISAATAGTTRVAA